MRFGMLLAHHRWREHGEGLSSRAPGPAEVADAVGLHDCDYLRSTVRCGRLRHVPAALWRHAGRANCRHVTELWSSPGTANSPERITRSIGALLVLGAGLAVGGSPVLVTGTNTPHYVGVALLILTVSAVLPWRALQVGAMTSALTLLFVTAGLLHDSMPDTVAFGTQISAILVTGVIGILVSQFGEQTRRREFEARRAIKRASKEKTQLIQNLEDDGTPANANEDLQNARETNDFLRPVA
jgi:hypothetical protein